MEGSTMKLTGNGKLPQPGPKTLNHKKRADYFWAYLMIAPLLIGLAAFSIVPILQTVFYSFTRYRGFEALRWIGLKNYQELLLDRHFWLGLKNTLIYASLSVPVSVIISIVVAVMLNSKIRGVGVYRTIFFLPQVSIPVAIAMLWKWLYNSDYGFINEVLSSLGFPRLDWITDPGLVLYSIIIVSIWVSIGFNMIILLAGIQNIPKNLYEASTIDGAGTFRKFFHITLPLLTPTTFFVVITSLISAFQVFDIIFLMIGQTSHVIENVESLVYVYYKYSFLEGNKGYGSAIAVVLLVIILLVTFVQLKLQKKWVHYE